MLPRLLGCTPPRLQSDVRFDYTVEVLEELRKHGVVPAHHTDPQLVRDFLSALYRFEIRRLKGRLLWGNSHSGSMRPACAPCGAATCCCRSRLKPGRDDPDAESGIRPGRVQPGPDAEPGSRPWRFGLRHHHSSSTASSLVSKCEYDSRVDRGRVAACQRICHRGTGGARRRVGAHATGNGQRCRGGARCRREPGRPSDQRAPHRRRDVARRRRLARPPRTRGRGKA